MDRARGLLSQIKPVFGSRLPPGVRDADCEPCLGPLEDAGESRLWQLCGAQGQERLSSQFVELHHELLRNAILDAEDSPAAAGSLERPRESVLAGRLWPAWVYFRDRRLRELRRSGELPGN